MARARSRRWGAPSLRDGTLLLDEQAMRRSLRELQQPAWRYRSAMAEGRVGFREIAVE